MPTFITTHRVLHNGQEYAPGAEFASEDAALIAHLRKVGAIALPAELARPEEIAAQVARLEAEKAALAEELDRLRAGAPAAEQPAADAVAGEDAGEPESEKPAAKRGAK